MRTITLLAMMAMSPGCWDGAYEKAEGREFDYDKAQTVRVGATRQSVIDLLGPPSSERVERDGSVLLTYSYFLERRSGIDVGVQVPTGHQRRERKAVIAIRGGRVVRVSVTDEIV